MSVPQEFVITRHGKEVVRFFRVHGTALVRIAVTPGFVGLDIRPDIADALKDWLGEL